MCSASTTPQSAEQKKAEPKSEPAAPAAAPAPTPAAPAPAAPAPPAPATETAAPASGTPEATAGSAAAGASAGGYEEAASQLARGSELEAKVAAIVDMGFPREEVQRAMRAAFNNPERAVEYLMSGIPAGLGVSHVCVWGGGEFGCWRVSHGGGCWEQSLRSSAGAGEGSSWGLGKHCHSPVQGLGLCSLPWSPCTRLMF